VVSLRGYEKLNKLATSPIQIFSDTQRKGERDRRSYTAHVDHGYTLKGIADYLGIHYSTVSKALKKRGKERKSTSYSRFKT